MLAVNRALMDRYADAWKRADAEAAMECYAGEIVLKLPGGVGLGGHVRGREAVVGTALTVFAALGELTEMVVKDMLFSSHGAAMFATETAYLDDGAVSWGWAAHYTIRAGKITEISVYVDDQAAVTRVLAARMRRAS